MSEYLEQKNAQFLNYWEKKRQNKRRFYLPYALGYGLLGGNLAYFWSIDFKLDQFSFLQYLLYTTFWILGGLLWAHLQYRGQEKHYQKLKSQTEI